MWKFYLCRIPQENVERHLFLCADTPLTHFERFMTPAPNNILSFISHSLKLKCERIWKRRIRSRVVRGAPMWPFLILRLMFNYKKSACLWLLMSGVKTQKQKTGISCDHSPFIWFIPEAVTGDGPLKWTQEGWAKYKCRTGEQGSFLGRQCFRCPALVASCPSGDSPFLQWNSGSSSLFDLQLRGQWTRGSAQAAWTTLDRRVGTFQLYSGKGYFRITRADAFSLCKTCVPSRKIPFFFWSLALFFYWLWQTHCSEIKLSRKKQSGDQMGWKLAINVAWLADLIWR